MRETFLKAVPAALRSRVARWQQSVDPADEVGAIWERVARGTLVGAGFGRDLFELRDDPAATWVAAYSATSGDDPITLQLTTRAMYARFGEDLLEPILAIARECPPARQREIARAHLAAAAESGTPASLRAKLSNAARWLSFHADGDGLLAEALETLRRGYPGDAVPPLVAVWRSTREPALLPIIEALGEEPNPFAVPDHRLNSDPWMVGVLADAAPDPRLATWLAPWVERRAQSRRPAPTPIARLLVDSLPATRALVDQLGIVADDPGVTPLDPALLDALVDASQRVDLRARALWAEVYANPTDMGPRSVLADLYLQRGDPRGAFMAAGIAELRGGPASGQHKLQRRQESAWLGALDALLGAPRTWRAGVLVRAVLQVGRVPWPPRRELRLIEELRLADPAAWDRLTPEAFPSLRVVGPIPTRALPAAQQSPLLSQLDALYVTLPTVLTALDREAIESFPDRAKLVVTTHWGWLGDPIAGRPASWWAELRRADRRHAPGALWPAPVG